MIEIKTETGLKRVYNQIQVNKLGSNKFGSWVSLKQDISTTYPGKKMSNSLSDGLFDDEDGEVFTQSRYCLIKVPEGTTEEQVNKMLTEKFPKAVIQRILSQELDDVITEEEKYAVEQEWTTMEALQAKKLIQDSEGQVWANNEVVGLIEKDDENNITGVAITEDNVVLEYKADVFKKEYAEDVDNRTYADEDGVVIEKKTVGQLTA